MKRLSWKPIRRGDVYCAPACGGGCTKEAYDKARKDAKATVKKLKTKGWKIIVWENLGWHWCLTNRLCGLSLSRRNGTFSCMLAEMDGVECSHGGMSFPQFKSFEDPNLAVSHAIKKSKPVFLAWIRGLENLNKIQP